MKSFRIISLLILTHLCTNDIYAQTYKQKCPWEPPCTGEPYLNFGPNTTFGMWAGRFINNNPFRIDGVTGNTFIGYLSGQNHHKGNGNTFLGSLSGNADLSSSENTFLGYGTGRRNTTGNSNAFVGSSAGYNNTNGSYNAFIGFQAGYRNTSGGSNAFMGDFAGYANTTGSLNVFIGSHVGFSNTIGKENTFLGNEAGFRNATGNKNAFMGSNAGYFNTTGSNNSFVGNEAGFKNTTGHDNAFIGYQSGYANTTGGLNTFTGSYAGRANTTGTGNAFVGYKAGLSNTSGGANAFVGFNAGRNNTIGTGNAYLGYNAGYANTSGSQNVFMGDESGSSNTAGKQNIFAGSQAGYYNTSGSGNAYFGYQAGNSINSPNLTNATAIGYQAQVSRSNSLILGKIAGRGTTSAIVNIGIGISAPTYQLQLSTSKAAKPGSSSWTVASDKRLKTNIEEFTDGLNVLLQVKPVKYRYNGKAEMPTDKEFVGIIAQEMKEIAPYTVGEFLYQDTIGKEEKYLDYDDSALTYMLVNAVKEQQKQLEAKDARIESLHNQLSALEQKFTQFEQRLSGLVEPVNSGVARLWQNAPNPYSHTTVIRYFVPQTASSAAIQLFNTTGQQVRSFMLPTRGEGEITLSASELAAGTYVYKLFVDGVGVDSKKLVMAR